jgi:hypothetical protein
MGKIMERQASGANEKQMSFFLKAANKAEERAGNRILFASESWLKNT